MIKINIQNRKFKSKGKVKKKFNIMILVSFLFLLLIFEAGNSSLPVEKNSDSIDFNNNDLKIDSPIPSDIVADEYTGIGQSLDLIHNANRTDSDIDLTFINGSQASHQIPLGENWEGIKLNADIENLRDNRNWVNGTFNYGDDDGTYGSTENDTLDIQNPYLNWTFDENDVGSANDMSGNYFNSTSVVGRDSLELLMHGRGAPNSWTYDQNDYCEWNASFSIPRGNVRDSNLNFQANPYYLMNFNSWEIQAYINGIKVYSIGTYSLKSLGAGSWHNFSIPMGLWTNSSNVFTGLLDNTDHTIAFQIRYIAQGATYNGFSNGDYQQVLLANVELEVKADVKADQIGLKMNSQAISSSSFGIGSITQYNSWTTTPVYANFTADDNSNYDYSVEFNSDLNLFAQKTSPTTNYETNSGSPGTYFSIANDTDSNWEFYSYFSVPTGYVEENFTQYFPSDWTITWVSTPQLPTTNVIGDCDTSNSGKLIIPVIDLSATPDGFWKFMAQSPNYVQNLLTLKNTTHSPGPSDWNVNNIFFSGDYLNITTQVKTSGVNFTELSSTHANLDIYFPNGTKWFSQSEEVAVLADGTIQFSSIQIPESGSDYVVGDYDVFVSWNNTDGVNPINETGMAHTQITVKHYSILVPDDDYIEDFLEGTTTSLRVNYFDIVSGEAIESAILDFNNLTSEIQTFNEIAPGYYFSEITAPPTNPGNNTLIINASHPLFDSVSVNITVDVKIKTTLTALEYPSVEANWNNSFEINLNYSELTLENGINSSDIDVVWGESYLVQDIGNGGYTITCNNSNTISNQIYTLEINAEAYGYEKSTIIIDIKIVARNTYLEVFMNGNNVTSSGEGQAEISKELNISIYYFDQVTQQELTGANITVNDIDESFYNVSNIDSTYEILMDTNKLGSGIHFLYITLEKENYSPITQQLKVSINSISTYFEIIIDGNDVTLSKKAEAPITKIMNITVSYFDNESLQEIQHADVELIGVDDTYYTVFNSSLSYQILLDTEKLGLGVHFVPLLLEKDNYSPISQVIEIRVNQIQTQISTTYENRTYTILPGENFDLQIFIEDIDFHENISDCEVTYTWKFDSGALNETSSGFYSITFEDVAEGIYTIYISVNKGPYYKFNSFEVTLIVVDPNEAGLPTYLFYIMGVLMVGLIGMFIAYQQYFKYPKTVREIRSLRKNLQKGKDVDLSVKTSQDLFVEDYISRTKGSLPSKNKAILKDRIAPGISPKSIAKGDIKREIEGEKVELKEKKITPKIPKEEKKPKISRKPSSLEKSLEILGAEQPKKVEPTQKIEKLKPDQFVKPHGIEETDLKPISKDQKPKKIRYLRKPKIKELPKKKKPKKD